MAITADDAKDELFGAVKVILDASIALFGYVPDSRWQGVELAIKPDDTKYWVRTSLQVVTDQQATLSNVQGQRVYEVTGLLYVQIFCPLNVDDSPAKGHTLGLMLQSKFRKQSGSAEIWFRNQRIIDLPESAKNYRYNFVTEFRYNTVQPIT